MTIAANDLALGEETPAVLGILPEDALQRRVVERANRDALLDDRAKLRLVASGRKRVAALAHLASGPAKAWFGATAMHRRTIAALNRINQHFYRSHAAAFSSTRKGAWRGWARLLELVSSHRHRLLPVRILDLGCGNGRFGRLAGTTLSPPHSYIGLDQSLPLLSEAARQAPGDFLAVDLSLPDSSIPLSSASVDLAVALGVLHHIPSFSRRRELIDEVTRCLVPGGLLALSHWQFGAEARFQRRALPWSKADTLLSGAIDPTDLEKGDFLLPWGEESSTPVPARYCHHVDPAEAERLIVGLPYSVLEVFSGDGRENRLNLYYLLRRHD